MTRRQVGEADAQVGEADAQAGETDTQIGEADTTTRTSRQDMAQCRTRQLRPIWTTKKGKARFSFY
jgi:hypothetical protein